MPSPRHDNFYTPDEAVTVSPMKTAWKLNVPAAEHGGNPLPRGLTISIFMETEAAFMCFSVSLILLRSDKSILWTYMMSQGSLHMTDVSKRR